MTPERFLYTLALTLMVYSLFVLWVFTGPIGIAAAAVLAHLLFRMCERQTDAARAKARKSEGDALTRAFRR
jgi:hypothetical protein